jgi:hypothetical protein
MSNIDNEKCTWVLSQKLRKITLYIRGINIVWNWNRRMVRHRSVLYISSNSLYVMFRWTWKKKPNKQTNKKMKINKHQIYLFKYPEKWKLCFVYLLIFTISVKDNKIIIYLINKETTCFIPPNIASTVQECLTLTLKNVLVFYHKSFGKSLSTSEV